MNVKKLNHMYIILKKWYSSYNDRVKAAVVRFWLNFQGERYVMERLGIKDVDSFDYLAKSHSGYVFISLSQDGVLMLINLPMFDIQSIEYLKENITDGCH